MVTDGENQADDEQGDSVNEQNDGPTEMEQVHTVYYINMVNLIIS